MRRAHVLIDGFIVAAVLVVVVAAVPHGTPQSWSAVPALPTSCYADDGFLDRLSTARHDLFVKSDAQENINTEIRQQSINMDMMAKQQKMMAFLQGNPTEAGQMMQEVAMAPQKAAAALERLSSRTKALDEQFKAAEEQYKADYAPLGEVHKKYLQNMPEPGNPGNPALVRQYQQQYNEDWARHCAKWLNSPDSALRKYLSDYKTFLIEEKIAAGNEKAEWEKKEFALYGIPATRYKAVEGEKAAIDYMDQVLKVYNRRPSGPLTGRL